MSQPNTPQGTGPMTLDQGVAHIKAKLAERGATVEHQTINHPEHPDLDEGQGPSDALGELLNPPNDSALEENANGVSADESAAQSQEPDTRSVTLPDGSQITVEEARKGYLRQADFTRKTTELARERERVAGREQAMLQEILGLHQHIASIQGAEPDWQRLARETTPAEFQRIQHYWRANAARVNVARQTAAQAEARAFAVERQRMWDTLATGSFEPAWQDSRALSSALDSISDYLIDRGVPRDLVGSIHLPAVIEIAEESRRYRELQKGKPKAALAVTGKPAPFKPGPKSAASPNAENIRFLNEAFLKKPSVDNAVALERARAASRRR